MAGNQVGSSEADLMLGLAGRDEYHIRGEVVDMTRPGVPPRVAHLDALPQKILIDLNKSALIVVDMQNDFCSEGGVLSALGMDTSRNQALYDPINRALVAARAQRLPVLWLNWGVRRDGANLSPGTRYTFSDKIRFTGLGAPVPLNGPRTEAHRLLTQGEWGAAIVDALDQNPEDIYVDKQRMSGFWDTPLDSILRTLQVKTLFFTGINSDHCVLSTLMDASFSGYDTVLIEDCTATTSPGYCHEAAIHNVRFAFGFTVTVEKFVEGLQAG